MSFYKQLDKFFSIMVVFGIVNIAYCSINNRISGSLNLENETLNYELKFYRASDVTCLDAVLKTPSPYSFESSLKQIISLKQNSSDAPWLNDQELCSKFLGQILKGIEDSGGMLPNTRFVKDLSSKMSDLYKTKILSKLTGYFSDTKTTFDDIQEFTNKWPIQIHIEFPSNVDSLIKETITNIVENSEIEFYQESEDDFEFSVSPKCESKLLMYISMEQDINKTLDIKEKLQKVSGIDIKQFFILDFQVKRLDEIINNLSTVKNKLICDFNSAWNNLVRKQQQDFPFFQRDMLEYFLQEVKTLESILLSLESHHISGDVLKSRRITLDRLIEDIGRLPKYFNQ